MKKINMIGILLLLSIIVLVGCSNSPEVNSAFNKANSEISAKFEKIGIEKIIVAKPMKGEFKYNFTEKFTGKVYILASKDQIEKNFKKEEMFLDGDKFESVVEDATDDFNIRYKGKTYFSVKEISIDNLSNFTIKTTYPKDFIICTAKEK